MLDGVLLSLGVETQQLSWKLGFRRTQYDFSDLNDLLNS